MYSADRFQNHKPSMSQAKPISSVNFVILIYHAFENITVKLKTNLSR